MHKNIFWPIAFKNCIAILTFAILAVKFDKWWVVLFAILFISSVEATRKHCKFCDRCGKHGPYAESHNAAIDEAKKAGWIRVKKPNGEWEDVCPDCQEYEGD